MITKMARMAELTGHTADAAEYRDLAAAIEVSFNDAFFKDALGRYTTDGNAGPEGATQAAQALAPCPPPAARTCCGTCCRRTTNPSYGHFTRSAWTRTGGRFTLDVTVPANTAAEVWLPAGSEPVTVPGRATFVRIDGGHAVYSVPSGRFVFTARTG